MIPDNFAATGLHVAGNGTRPTRFQVLGERSSGTNYVKRLLGRNTALTPTEALGWKHAHPHATAIPADLAVICVTRHAVPWALSMHAKPWHCPPAMQALAFSDFIRAPWETVVDRARYFGGAVDLLGQPLQLDRDPVSGLPYPDLAALRTAKLRGLTSYANRGCTFVLLRMEQAVTQPAAVLAAICTGLDLPAPNTPLRPVVKRLGSKFLPAVPDRPQPPKQMQTADLDWLRDRLDMGLEARLGYSYD
ncbi:MAG: hypothetical protein B7X55_06425 [Rhodobacterales bacterium 34-62-10]|nr:MAG: hypothetical protein B7X55_06425 [Rhodobacterales bacterium 34-62-10]